jgi:hypothetical protein
MSDATIGIGGERRGRERVGLLATIGQVDKDRRRDH